MSRSRKKNPIIGNVGGDSEKYDKRMANRRLRKKARYNLNHKDFDELDEDDFSDIKEVSEIWTFNKDGKQWLTNDLLETDPEYYDKLLRK